MTTPEGKVEKYLKKEVQASGGKVRKLKWIGKSGAPDRLMWWPAKHKHDPMGVFARAAFVELKAANKKPTKIQEEEHQSLREDGFVVLVLDSTDAVDRAIVLVRDGVVVPVGPAAGTAPAPKPRVPPVKAWAPPVKQPELPKQDNSDLI